MRASIASVKYPRLQKAFQNRHAFTTSHNSSSIPNRYLKVSEEVSQAIAEHRPVVALESTIYTHGFPYPENAALASSLESIVRTVGAVPATIGILDGIARVGLERQELLRLAASSQDSANLLKISRRDFGIALGTQAPDGRLYNGGTTIAGTMLLAHLAGIKIFATGGLGGVHRGAEETFDISADLTELGRTPVAVIAAGCKAFLDIPKTLEYLETQGVPVMTFADGRSGRVDFPGFWSRDSGHRSPMTIQGHEDAAAIIRAQTALGIQSGLLFANPVPAQYEIPVPKIQGAISQALAQASTAGATGNAATPFILNKIKELTGAQSIRANTALVEANVTIGARIAIELSRLQGSDHSPVYQPAAPIAAPPSEPSITPIPSTPHTTSAAVRAEVFVAGMLAVDFACDYAPREHAKHRSMEMATSNPARITQSLGGVGHNVALAAHLSGVNVMLCSAVGDDMNGSAALDALRIEGLSAQGVSTLQGSRTAQYVAVNDNNKDLIVAMADMAILEGEEVEQTIASDWQTQINASEPSHVVIDANWSPKHLHTWLTVAKKAAAYTIFEPVSTAKATGLFASDKNALGVFPNPSLDLTTPNSSELTSMYEAAREQGLFDRQDWWQVIDAFGISSAGARAQLAMATTSELVDEGVPQKTLQLLPYIPCITTKLGAQGVLLTQIIPAGDDRLINRDHAPYILSRCNNETEQTVGVGGVYMRLFPVPEQVAAQDIVSVNGVGDTFAGVLVAGLAKLKKDNRAGHVEDLIDVAQRASVLTLKSTAAVSPGLRVLSMLI